MQLLFWLVIALWVGVSALAQAAAKEEYEVRARELPSIQAAGFTGGGPSNQFPRLKGLYNGLIMPTEFVAEQSGFFEITVDADRDFRGRMLVGDRTYPLRGRFTTQGLAGIDISRRDWDDCRCSYELRHIWSIDLQLIAGTDEIEGIADNVRHGFTTSLFGYRGHGTPDGISIDEGRYTMRLPGSADSAVAPGGEGYGVVKVTSRSRVQMYGRLADGTAYSRGAAVSTNGWWPYYLPLSQGRGALIGWLRFALHDDGDVAGDLFWVKPRLESRKYYPDGFSGNVPAIGSRYTIPSSSSLALNWTSGIFFTDGGNLVAPAVNQITLLPGGKLSDSGGDITNLKYRFSRGTGVFSGKFMHPDSGRMVSFKGVLDQFQAVGGGHFLGVDQTGLVRLQASP